MKRTFAGVVVILLCAIPLSAHPQAAAPRVTINKTDAPVTVDGDLSDPALQNATKYETWYESNPGDNIEP